MKPILEKLLAITFKVLKQELITILPKVEVGYQRTNSPLYVMLSSCLESLETLFHKRVHDTLNNPSRKFNDVTSYQLC